MDKREELIAERERLYQEHLKQHDEIAKKTSLSKTMVSASPGDRVLIYQVDPTQLLNACLHMMKKCVSYTEIL